MCVPNSHYVLFLTFPTDFKSPVLYTQNFKSQLYSQKCMIRHLNTHFSEKKKSGSPYTLIICNPTGLIIKKDAIYEYFSDSRDAILYSLNKAL